MMSIVRHRAIAVARGDALRASRTARIAELDRLLGEDADVADVALVAEDTDRLRGLLLRLPAKQREVIGLAFYGQLTHREISEHLGLPPGTIKGRMRLGLEKLRAEIDS
jgi:RNA polymerase sigma-70 factor (ECF subfamily)